jgi:hypothetical protein
VTNEELAQIQAGALRYHTMSSEVVLRLLAEIERLKKTKKLKLDLPENWNAYNASEGD